MPVRNTTILVALLALMIILAGLGFDISGASRTSPHVVKIALVAPFEGRFRAVGYEIIPAARLAIREYALVHPGNLASVELVAFDDSGIPRRAVNQARAIVGDSDIRVVIGHWRDDTTMAALPVYAVSGLSVITVSPVDTSHFRNVLNLSPSATALNDAARQWAAKFGLTVMMEPANLSNALSETAAFTNVERSQPYSRTIGGPDWGLEQFRQVTNSVTFGPYFVSGAAFPESIGGPFWTAGQIEKFRNGLVVAGVKIDPGIYSAMAYEATWQALRMIVGEASHADFGPASDLYFATDGRKQGAEIYLYQWQHGARVFIDSLP